MVAPVNPVSAIPGHEAIAPHLLSTKLADGRSLKLAPAPVTTPPSTVAIRASEVAHVNGVATG